MGPRVEWGLHQHVVGLLVVRGFDSAKYSRGHATATDARHFLVNAEVLRNVSGQAVFVLEGYSGMSSECLRLYHSSTEDICSARHWLRGTPGGRVV